MRLGIDLGGTKIAGVVLDRAGAVVARDRMPTPAEDFSAIVEAIVAMVQRLETQVQTRCSIGVGTPGSPSPVTAEMRNSNTTCLNGRRLREELAVALGRGVRIANDANCFALSEATDGAGRGADPVFGVILGTGTGAGLVIGGRVVVGANAIAGEWGHNPLPWPTDADQPARACYCGKHGCLETYLCGPAMAEHHRKRAGNELAAYEIAAAAERGDGEAQATLAIYTGRLARGLASVINVVDPEVIVLGGGLSNMKSLYRDLPAALARWVFSDCLRTRVVQAQHGDESGVRGAAWLGESA